MENHWTKQVQQIIHLLARSEESWQTKTPGETLNLTRLK